MKTNFTFIAVFFLMLFFLQSCFSPQSVVRLNPEKEDVKWLYGQQFISDSINGVIYEVGFDQMSGNRYLFDFSITNRSNLPILIDPHSFYIQAFDGKMQPLTETRVAAIDPENEILELEKQISRNEAQELNQIATGLVAATVDLTTGIALATDDNPHNDHLRTHLTHHSMAMAAHNSQEIMSLDEVKEAWKSSTVRKTTLQSSYNMKGKVFFPAFRDAVYIKLYLPVDEEFLELGYQQIQFPVK